ncbi:MAG TPA: class I SAM-dependent methyltransferase, partial [Nannocystaceae bacterium]|nr:class I SAM-dependent methyltransferase [Nannocystaceae bacterium]
MTRGAAIVAQLRKPLARVLRAGHPWVFRDALQPFRAAAGDVVTVVDDKRKFVARGLADDGPIGVRVFTTKDEGVDEALFERRIALADELRATVVPPDTNAYRLLHGEGDRFPGLVCDVYDSWAVIQLDGAALVSRRQQLLELLRPRLAARGIVRTLVRYGRRTDRTIEGRPPSEPLIVREHGMMLVADLAHGQKTGLFLDHRESRRRIRALAHDRRVLDLYAYVGGFSAAAGLGGARSVDTVDVAAPAIEASHRTWLANGLHDARRTGHASDVPAFLERAVADARRWDLVIADPPSFAPSEGLVDKALASYVQLHAAALRVLAPGGLLLAASCSSHIDAPSFAAALVE